MAVGWLAIVTLDLLSQVYIFIYLFIYLFINNAGLCGCELWPKVASDSSAPNGVVICKAAVRVADEAPLLLHFFFFFFSFLFFSLLISFFFFLCFESFVWFRLGWCLVGTNTRSDGLLNATLFDALSCFPLPFFCRSWVLGSAFWVLGCWLHVFGVGLKWRGSRLLIRVTGQLVVMTPSNAFFFRTDLTDLVDLIHLMQLFRIFRILRVLRVLGVLGLFGLVMLRHAGVKCLAKSASWTPSRPNDRINNSIAVESNRMEPDATQRSL